MIGTTRLLIQGGFYEMFYLAAGWVTNHSVTGSFFGFGSETPNPKVLVERNWLAPILWVTL